MYFILTNPLILDIFLNGAQCGFMVHERVKMTLHLQLNERVYLSSCWTVINRVLMDGFQVSEDVCSTDHPAHLKRNHNVPRQKKQTKKTPLGPSEVFTFQPVAQNIFPALPIVRVRSHMPGRLAAKHKTPPIITWTDPPLRFHNTYIYICKYHKHIWSLNCFNIFRNVFCLAFILFDFSFVAVFPP